jgi:hypothetical protein
MTSLRLAIIVVLLAAVCGCTAATRATRFAAYPPRPADHEIRIYRTTVPEEPYEEIGIVSSRQRNKFISMEAVLESLKQQAREMGGDAIIGLTEANEAQGFVGDTGILDRDPVLSGTVIRFLEDDK